jgi:ParB family transcriptional regulator, chromosome partitioning protein
MKIQWIKIEAIEPNQRCICNDDFIEQLADTIREQGQTEPIKVWFTGGCFRIIDGEKRWRACKKLGLSRVKVIILEMET